MSGPTMIPPRSALILHGGGDAPGMNATLLGFARGLEQAGWKAYGVKNGWQGLTAPEPTFLPLRSKTLWRKHHLPGSLLKTGHRHRGPFDTIEGIQSPLENALSQIAQFEGGLFVVGGNGSGWVAEKLYERGARIFFSPGTIDGDIPHMESIGFESAAAEGFFDALKLYSTGSSCVNAMILEIMGANRGALPFQVGFAAGADYVIIPEVKVDLEEDVAPRIQRALAKEEAALIVVAEGANFTYGSDGSDREFLTPRRRRQPPAKRKIGETLARIISQQFDLPAKEVAVKYLLRGTPPLPIDISRGTAAGLAAARTIVRGQSGLVIPPSPIPATNIPLRGFLTQRIYDDEFTQNLIGRWQDYYLER